MDNKKIKTLLIIVGIISLIGYLLTVQFSTRDFILAICVFGLTIAILVYVVVIALERPTIEEAREFLFDKYFGR